MWQKAKLALYIIAEVRDLEPEAKGTMNQFCQLVWEHVSQPVMAFFEEAMPDYAFLLKRYVTKVLILSILNPNISPESIAIGSLPLLPNIDLGPAFATTVFKKGGSLSNHADPDHKNTWAIIVCEGDYEGGRFCLPHMQQRLHLPPGSIFTINASTLVHSTSPFSGDRYIITGFIEWNLSSAAGVGKPEFFTLTDKEYDNWIRTALEPKVIQCRKEEAQRLANQSRK